LTEEMISNIKGKKLEAYCKLHNLKISGVRAADRRKQLQELLFPNEGDHQSNSIVENLIETQVTQN